MFDVFCFFCLEGLYEQIIVCLNNLDVQVDVGFEVYFYSYFQIYYVCDVFVVYFVREEGIGEGGMLEFGQKWEEESYLFVGCVILMCYMGKVVFVDLSDEDGKIQLFFFKQDIVGFDVIKKIDFGDIIGVKGYFFVIKIG